ncbi:hypothetical protein OOK58_38480 [Streptomyces sp. NBC_01728]|uniref:hypothetical protein n=1 Tax=unclassified Streptomyces TaxID=2593676 RepID=UPI002252931F|nr:MULTISPECIES: hypothetical protein [unclassified Streptomyces]MCX4457837.1 hypothetical protein [Streptomyces sp. NBC_01719]MCX4497194.1 hypothetical protein [Streptomyces sp. NBC_01728]MCX4588266.1 hypothetical protein [Streptomyces sp. NBC_01549]
MRLSISHLAPIPMGLTLAAFGVVTSPATAHAATPGPDLLGVSQSATAPTNPVVGTPPAEASKTSLATSQALIVNVTSCSESDLQAAIGAVATVGGTVNLRPRCTYTLTDAAPPNDDNGLPVIKNKVTINGRGDTITRAATAANFRFFEIDGTNGNLTLNNLTLSNGHASNSLGNGRGGAIWLSGTGPALTLNDTSLTTNTADTYGGAIDNDNGAVSVNRSTLHNNRASAGGAVFVSPFGGSGTATVDRSRITGNHATILAGGIAAAVGTTVTLTRTRLTDNDVTGTNAQGGGIAQAGTMTLKRSEVIGNTTTGSNAQGGGIFNTSGTVKLTDTLVADNTTNGTNSRGGGIFNTGSGTVALTHSLVTNNRALGTGADGGGIFKASGTVTRIVSPVALNQPNNCGNPSSVPGCS